MIHWLTVIKARAAEAGRRDTAGFTRLGLLGIVLVLGLLIGGVVFAVNRGDDEPDDNATAGAVALDEQPLRKAEDSFHGKFGRYGTQDELVAAGLLSKAVPDKAVNLQDGSCTGKVACAYTIGERLERVRLAGSATAGYPSPFRASPGTGGIQNVSFMFDSLTWLDAKGDVIPALAKSWETSVGGDPTKLRFALREGVKWSDGVPFDADDVVFTWDYQRPGQPGHLGTNTAAAFSQKGVVNVEALSPTLVEFTMSSADATFLYLAATRNFIVPRHVWEGVTDPQSWDDPKAQVGTGPYTLATYDAAQGTYAFDAKDSYFMGTPYAKRLELVAAGPDPLQALQSGVIDLADVGSGTYTMAQLDSLDPATYGRLTTGGISTYVIMWNMEKYPYNDKRFRQAVAKAIDRTDMASRLFPLGGTPTNIGMVQPTTAPWNPPDVLKAYLSKDVDGANTLLDEVGLARNSQTGMREINSAPFRPTFQVCATDAFTAVREYLLAVGIDAQAEPVTCDFGPASQMNNNATSGNYEMILRTFGPTSDPDGLRSFLSEPMPPGTWWHSWGWPKASPAKQAEFETLLNEQRAELDEAARIKKAWELERLVADELPQLFLVGGNRIAVFRKSVISTWNWPGPAHPGGPATMSTAAYNKLHFINIPPA